MCTGRYCSSLLISYPRTAVGGMCWLVRPSDLKKLQAACHGFYAKVLEMFFGTAELPVTGSFLEGVHCTCSTGTFVFKAQMGPLLADEKAIKEVWCVKGASGSKPCFQCQNVVGHCSPEDVAPNGWLVHTSCCKAGKFVPHSDSRFQAMGWHPLATKMVWSRQSNHSHMLGLDAHLGRKRRGCAIPLEWLLLRTGITRHTAEDFR